LILSDENSPEVAIWQLVESCGYSADLPVWTELAEGSRSVLDLGCGIGRVTRHLAAEGREVLGVDIDPLLVDELNRISGPEPVSAITGSVTGLSGLNLGRDRFETIIAPQQLLHILGGRPARLDLLTGVKDRLEPEGIAAFAISEWVPDVSRPVDVLPDVREIEDRVYASRPVAVEEQPESLTVVRLRQIVGPDGSFEESEDRITLYRMDRHSLAAELEEAGLVATRSIEVPETDRHIGSVIVVARHDAGVP